MKQLLLVLVYLAQTLSALGEQGPSFIGLAHEIEVVELSCSGSA